MLKHPAFSNIIYVIISLISAALAACLLLYAVYALPIKNIRKNVSASTFTHLQEGEVYPISRKFPGSRIDNFTASLMLNTAAFLGRNSIFYDALTNPRTDYGGHNQVSNLFLTAQNESLANAHIINHPRYWHGYLVFLKPLLLFFDIQNLRIINFVTQNILLLLVIFLLYRHTNFKYTLSFFLAVVYMNPIAMGLSLSYCGIYYIMLISMLYILITPPLKQDWKLFLWIGIATSFIDMLTAPLITLAFPLILYISLKKTNFQTAFTAAVRTTICWSIGYLGMWFLKWAIATLMTDDNIIKDGLSNILYRTAGNGYQETGIRNFTPLNAIKINLRQLDYNNSILIALLYFLLITLNCFIKKCTFIKDKRALLLLLISLSPFLWYSVAVNHSIIHPLMSYRELCITIFALTTALTLSLTPDFPKKPYEPPL